MIKKMLLEELHELDAFLRMSEEEIIQLHNLKHTEFIDSYRVGWAKGKVNILIRGIEEGE